MKKETVTKAFKRADDLDYAVDITTTNMIKIHISPDTVHNLDNEIEFTDDCIDITVNTGDQQDNYIIPYEHIVTINVNSAAI